MAKKKVTDKHNSLIVFEHKIDGVGFNIKKLQSSESGEVNIFIHGFRAVKNNDDILLFKQQFSLLHNSTNILIHWDSYAKTIRFKKAEGYAEKLALNFGQLLKMSLQGCNYKKVNIIGHSLGGRIIVNGFLNCKKSQQYPLGKVVLLGAAVEWPSKEVNILENEHIPIFNFYSDKNDLALMVKPDLEKSVGQYAIKSSAKNIYNINCCNFSHFEYWPNLELFFDFIGFSDDEKYKKFPKGEVIMLDEMLNIKKRIKNMKELYNGLDDFFNSFGEKIPTAIVEKIKDAILNDEELKKIFDDIDNKRPPKVLLIGRTGVGKSSLVNALLGKPCARVSDVQSCTSGAEHYSLEQDGQVTMNIIDTRGLVEAVQVQNDKVAEDQLVEEIKEFVPDIALLVMNSMRDDVSVDIEFIKSLRMVYEQNQLIPLPILVTVNRVDELAPARIKKAEEYNDVNIKNIDEILKLYKDIFKSADFEYDKIIGVSSYIDWCDEEGNEVSAKDIKNIPKNMLDKLNISFDGRYNIEELKNIMIDAIKSTEAQRGLSMAFQLHKIARQIAEKIVDIFSSMSAAIAITPIPASDIYILLLLQSTMIGLIVTISGRSATAETTKEFMYSLGGVGLAGVALRRASQQASKLLNLFPGAGSFVSASIASLGTKSIGKSAIEYFLDQQDLEKIRKELQKTKECFS